MRFPGLCATSCCGSWGPALTLQDHTAVWHQQLLNASAASVCVRRQSNETHELAERKIRELEKVRKAWGIGESSVEGEAFNRDLQVGCPPRSHTEHSTHMPIHLRNPLL